MKMKMENALRDKHILELAAERKIGQRDKKFSFIGGGKYRYSDSRRFRKVYLDEDLTELMDGNWAMAGHLNRLLNCCDSNNMICIRDPHEKCEVPATTVTSIFQLAGYSDRKSGGKFVSLLQQKKIISSCVIDKKYKRFYINPTLTIRASGISLELYKMFKEQIDEKYPQARYDFEWLCYIADHADELEVKAKDDNDDDDVKEIPDDFLSQLQMDPEVVEVDNAREQARAAEFNPFLTAAIVNEYLYRGQQPQLYAMADGGMVKTGYSADKDIYFTVNTPAVYLDKKPKNSDIANFNSWYVDIDAGKDENGHYFDVTEVEKRKELMKAVINQLPTATYINSTRNGYHIYFACCGIKNEEEWRRVEDKLIEVITIADKAVKDPARLMRMPGSYWHKNDKSAAAGCESYHCHPLVANRIKYTAAELLAELDKVAENVKKACDSYQLTFGNDNNEGNGKIAAKVNVTVDDSARIADIRNLGTATFDIPAATTIVDNAKDWLRQQSLASFLQIANPSSFTCIFHDDEHPSATIYNNESGDRYVCAAASCGVSAHGWDIIDCVMALANCDFVTALQYLTTIYNIKEG